MRANCKALQNSPAASRIQTREGEYLKLRYPSFSAMHDAAKEYARTANESVWLSSSHWAGLGKQSINDFERTGVANDSLAAVKRAAAKMPQRFSRPSNPHAAIAGGFWDTPSVLANLPLAARIRKRAKLPPINLKFAVSLSASVSADEMAVFTVKLARAVWEYTIAGGAVTLTVASFGNVRDATYTGVMVECLVNCADVATLATVLSPVNDRLIGSPLESALSGQDNDGLSVPRNCPIPGYIYIGGVGRNAFVAASKALEQLQITETV